MNLICAFVFLTIALKECKDEFKQFNTEINQKFNNIVPGTAIWCYRCTSATPGCSDKFNWRGIGYLGDPCPESDDICVKVTEKKGGKCKH